MTGETDTDKALNVSSIGNAWVVCRSKSHPGYKYYFNTLTGEAAWNLSDTEIEKAKNLTKILPSAELEKCSEPKGSPMDHPINTPSTVFNKQIINNQFPNQIPNVYGLMPTDPRCSSTFNPNVWAKPPNTPTIVSTPPFFILQTANLTPFVNQPTTSYGVQCTENFSQNLFTNYRNNPFKRGYNVSNRGQRPNINFRSRFAQKNNFQRNKNWKSSDLRGKLLRKRSKSQSHDGDCWEDDLTKTTDHFTKEKRFWNNDGMQETPSKFDLSILKQLKCSELKSEHWFIVVDIEILLNNFPFLNSLTDPDQNCYLMVPDHVMKELNSQATSQDDVHARRIYRFLSEQIDLELAYRGDDVSDICNDDYDKIFITCIHLAKENNVVLLSNDSNFMKYGNINNNVHLFTMNDLKAFLKNGPMNEMRSFLKLGPMNQTSTVIKHPALAIKISVPNDKKYEANKDDFMTPRSMTPDKVIQCHFEEPCAMNKNICVTRSAITPPLLQGMVEAGVQTGDPSDDMDCVDHTLSAANGPGLLRSEITAGHSTVLNNERKKEIKLNRRPYNQNVTAEESMQRKKLRWRKHRGNVNCHVDKSNSSPTKDNAVVGTDHVAHHVPITLKDMFSNTESKVSESLPKSTFTLSRPPSLDTSNASSVTKKAGYGNVVVEETTTSGVLSITNDSESESGNTRPKEKILVMRNVVMFEVEGQSMEEVLRTRREEWVLRFVQIMEEILREKLRDNSAFHLHEAAKCIIKKYSNHFYVVDAANKLSFTLYKISDDKGNINPNIEPSEYMEMYSYGVYLLDTLKDVSNNCEDLRAADESLKRLLYDIQNPNLDTSHNDTFTKELHETEVNITEPMPVEEETPHQVSVDDPKDSENDYKDSSIGSYRLRPRNRKAIQIHKHQRQKNLAKLEATFFSSLQLQKRLDRNNSSHMKILDLQDSFNNEHNPIEHIQTSPKAPPSPRSPQGSPKTQLLEKQDTSSVKSNAVDFDTSHGDNNTPGVAVQPIVIRNFSNIEQFDERWNKRSASHQDCQEKNYDDIGMYSNGYYDENEDLEEGEIMSDDPNTRDSLNTQDRYHECGNDNDENFKWFIGEFLGEIRQVFQEVHLLCCKIVQEKFSSHQGSSPTKRTNLLDKAEKATAILTTISNSLSSILDREFKEPDNSIKNLLSRSNMEDLVPSEELLSQYTKIISKCKDQVVCTQSTLTSILKAAQNFN